MKSRQLLLLLIALLFPSCIFIFLKIFGKNRFDVPPMFVDAVTQSAGACDVNYQFPYQVADSVLKHVGLEENHALYVYFDSGESERVFTRVEDRYKNDPVAGTHLDPERDAFLKQCIFLLEEPFNAVLVDRNGVIRGQYDLHERDEVDRLITEIAILLEKY